MSRISSGNLDRMKDQILKDLYGAFDKQLADRATEIAKNSRQCWISPYQDALDQLPDELIAKHTHYTVEVNYPWNRPIIKDVDVHTGHFPRYTDEKWENLDHIREDWGFMSPTPIANPLIFNSYGSTTTELQKLHPDVLQDAETLCKDKIQLLKEKARMQKYLHDTTNKNTTHKQLREVLPASLHRYLPPEKVKKKAVKKEARQVETPEFLGERQTINLLEDN